MKRNHADRPAGAARAATALLLAAVGAVVAVGCRGLSADSPLENGRSSAEALAEAALDALRGEDDAALKALMITRDEYEHHVWPSLPDREYVPLSFSWGIKEPRSRKALRENTNAYGGLPLELVRVDLGEEVEEYEAFTLYLDARMTVRNRDTGQEGVLPLMKAVIEMGGAWKFMGFREDL